jgi:hypothetical protein
MRATVRRTTRKVSIRFGGKTYRRRVYEFLDEEIGWWRDCVKLGSMSVYNPDCYVPLDTFEEYSTTEEAACIPGRWA